MSTAIMTERIAEVSPCLKARVAGVLYLICGIAFSFADGSVRGKLVVLGDATATAHNILAYAALFRLGFATELISAVCYITVTLIGCAIQALSTLFHLAPLVILGGEPYLSVFKVEQLQALALMFLKLRVQITSIYMVFFGCYCLLIGYLIFRSTFMPRILGVFMAIAGLSYQLFLSPPLANYLFPYIVKPAGALGELSLILWLLVMGVNNQRWKEQACAAGMHA